MANVPPPSPNPSKLSGAADAQATATPPHAVESGTETQPRLPLPHERDESATDEQHPPEPVIEQAGKDLQRGLSDTDLRGTAADAFDKKFGPRRKHGTP